MATGGDIVEITYTHPVLGTGRLDPKGSEDTEIDFGGYLKQDNDDGVRGSGTVLQVMNRKRWSVTVPPVAWDSDPDTMETLQSLTNDPLDSVWTFTFIDGAVYKGSGSIVGDLKGNKNAAAVSSFKIAGGGSLESIA